MPHCPGSATKSQHQAVRDTLEVISGKWKLVILAALLERPYRFKELSREISISPRILAKELQELEQHRLATRTVRDTRPVTVEYACTAHAQSLVAVVQAMSEWGYRHHEAVVGRKRADDPAGVAPTWGRVAPGSGAADPDPKRRAVGVVGT